MPKEFYNGIHYNTSPIYSDRDMTGYDLSGRKDMDGLVIHGLCLSNETPDARVLPANLKGVIFLFCNLDNVFIPPGNTVDASCLARRFKAQNDKEDWIVDPSTLKPSSPLDVALFVEKGISTDPKNIPPQPLPKPITADAVALDAVLGDVAVAEVGVK